MSRIEEIDKIVDEIGDAYSLYEFAECVYEDRQRIAELEEQLEEKEKEIEKLREWLSQCEANRKFEQEKKNLVFKKLTEMSEQLKSQPAEIVEKIRKELGLKLKYKLNDEVSVLKICNKINEVLDTILKEYQK